MTCQNTLPCQVKCHDTAWQLTLSVLVRVPALMESPFRKVMAVSRRREPSLRFEISTVTSLLICSLAMMACLNSFPKAVVKVAIVKEDKEAVKVTMGIEAAVEGLATFCRVAQHFSEGAFI